MAISLIERQARQLLSECCFLDVQHIDDALGRTTERQGKDAYSTNKIRKKSGGVRTIHAPCEDLVIVQRALLRFLYNWPCDSHLFAYCPGRSSVDNARFHIWEWQGHSGIIRRAPKWVLRMDLKDAFPSMTTDMLKGMFTEMFSPSAKYLESTDIDKRQEVSELLVQMLVQLTTRAGKAVQGAPTSPYLLNLVWSWTGIIEKINALCQGRKDPFKLSIYSDDITVSSRKVRISSGFANKLKKIIEENGYFQVNQTKTNITHSKRGAHIITGISLSSNRDFTPLLAIPGKTLKSLRGIIHRVTRIIESHDDMPLFALIGPENDLTGEEHTTLEQVHGYIAWIKDVYRERDLPPSVKQPIANFEKAWKQHKHLKKLEDTS